MTEPEITATTQQPDSTEAELAEIGTFEPRVTMPLVEELNRRKIKHRVQDKNHFTSTLHALKQSFNEAAEVLAEIKKKHPRVRL